MSKKEIIEFTCDNCSKKITVEKINGFPYKKGWHYIFSLQLQIPPDNTKTFLTLPHQRINKTDLHFCSKECLLKYVEKQIKGVD